MIGTLVIFLSALIVWGWGTSCRYGYWQILWYPLATIGEVVNIMVNATLSSMARTWSGALFLWMWTTKFMKFLVSVICCHTWLGAKTCWIQLSNCPLYLDLRNNVPLWIRRWKKLSLKKIFWLVEATLDILACTCTPRMMHLFPKVAVIHWWRSTYKSSQEGTSCWKRRRHVWVGYLSCALQEI